MQSKAILAFVATFSFFCMAICNGADGHGSFTRRSAVFNKRDNSPPPSRHGKLNFTQNANVTRVTINNPPINLLTAELISDLLDFLIWTRPGPGKTTPKVVVFSSALPDFFISHFDLKNLASPAALNQLVDCGRLLQNVTSTAFIAEVNGRTFGGGQELNSQMDMRFAGPNALVSQYENSCGFVAQAGGQISLGPIVGKARALELLLASKQINAQQGTDLGLFNNNYPDANTLRREVDALAARIGLFSQAALNDTKFSLAFMSPTPQQLDQQIINFAPVASSPVSQGVVREVLRDSDQSHNEYEVNIPNSVVQTLYSQELNAMGDGGKGVLDAAGAENLFGWEHGYRS
ncbi:MAG: hypothetical protein LQ338_007651 [Usnochroma carphineum]|nr:MAG: hypothetical protein LQ338_007651 [Usnochroma carphineum]